MAETGFHPRREPEFPGPLTWENVMAVYGGCADLGQRLLRPAGAGERAIRLCWLEGRVKTERLGDYVLRPILEADLPPAGDWLSLLREQVLWNQSPQPCADLDQALYAMLDGACLLFLKEGVLRCMVPTEEKRAVSKPENEGDLKGAKDSFVESLRTNTALLRGRLKTPRLAIRRQLVGRRTRTAVEVLWLQGICDPALPAALSQRLEAIEEDGVITTAELEEYLADPTQTLFPRLFFTERPDRVCQGLLEGRMAILIDGIPLGCILPGDLSQFMQAPQDRTGHWASASALRLVRYLCLAVTLLLPGLYIAVAVFHFELIPTKLAVSMIASKQDVPFPTALEVMGLLVAFEILQEAGLRFPNTIGQTVSIIGGLVVGQAAVDAKIVSPVVVIVVAVSGIAGFTMPNQDLSNALRIWRFGLALLAALMGIFGLTIGVAALLCHLAGLEDFGVPYLSAFTGPRRRRLEEQPLWRRPIPEVKYRLSFLHPRNGRKRR